MKVNNLTTKLTKN